MNEDRLHDVLTAFGIRGYLSIKPHGNGLINQTYRVSGGGAEYILQKLNDSIFSHPAQIAENIERVGAYILSKFPGIVFPIPLQTIDGRFLLHDESEGYFRLFLFVRNSITIAVVESPSQAYQASKKFGEFTRMLSGFPIDLLQETLPDFHNLSFRYRVFCDAVQKGSAERKKKSEKLIHFLESQSGLVTAYEKIRENPEFRLRVTHHDTKISNVLFDQQGKGLCVIDLDTVMPGYFISDVGDMFRTYISPVSEEEKDFSKIEIRLPIIEAIITGYLEEMKDELTMAEKAFKFAGEFMIYMQSLRFLTDYLNDDVYYGRNYEDHNYFRAGNQATLLTRFQEQY